MSMHASAAPISCKNVSIEDVRRSVTYHPNIWGDHFLAYSSIVTDISIAEKEEHERQKEKVKTLLAQTPHDSMLKVELIDAIQRLGIGYQFEKEIEKSLKYIHDTYLVFNSKEDNLHVVALRFRLLRQQGYPVPCDVFKNFIDDEGNFKVSLVNDFKGILDLYEASYFAVRGEEILNKALEFSSSHLRSLVHKTNNSFSKQVKEALEIPIRKSFIRLAATKFIPIYQEDESHNEILLSFSKLDFNMVQKMHQKELNDLTRWWKDLDLGNRLPFARDRLVESYLWITGVYFEPHQCTARRMLTKVLYLCCYGDDIYDVYGTLDELQLLTNIIQSWEIKDMGQLPSYMRIFYKALLDLYSEMEDEMGKVGNSYRVQYAREEMKKAIKSCNEEAKWTYTKHKPTMEEYMNVGLVSFGYMLLSTTSLVGMEDPITKEDFDWVSREPLIIRAASVIGRLMDDMAGYGSEQKITAVQCYMNQHGASEKETFAKLEEQVKSAWKDINEECMEPRVVSMSILMRVVNLARVINLLYVGEDAYGNANSKTKDFIKGLFIDPVTT